MVWLSRDYDTLVPLVMYDLCYWATFLQAQLQIALHTTSTVSDPCVMRWPMYCCLTYQASVYEQSWQPLEL